MAVTWWTPSRRMRPPTVRDSVETRPDAERCVTTSSGPRSPRRLPPSPDLRANALRAHHRIAVLAAPGRAELRHVGHRAVDAPLGRGVRVGLHLGSQVLVC